MDLKNCSIDIKADLFIATTFIEMEFCNSNDRDIEGLYQFELKPGQVITSFQLSLNGKYRDGSIEERWKAANAYNSVVGKRIDPALLTMIYPEHYTLRIYPIPAKGCRKITMTVQQLLNAENNNLVYSLPLNIGNTVDHFVLNIATDRKATPATKAGLIVEKLFAAENEKYALHWEATNISLKGPIAFSMALALPFALCTQSNQQQTFFALRFMPSLSGENPIHPKTATIFWDASASQSKRDINKEINFLKQFISYHRIPEMTIIPFNHKLLDTATFQTENSNWQQYLRDIDYDGATQLGLIDLAKLKSDIFFLFTDGNNTYGKSGPKTGSALITCVHTSPVANLESLRKIVGAGGGKVIDLNKVSMSSAVNSCSQAETWLMDITSASRKVLIEQTMPARQQTTLLINGSMPAGNDTLYFYYGNNSRVTHIERIPVRSTAGCTGSAIDRITMLGNFDRVIRHSSWSNLIDFGLREKIVTPNTAYIVLERVEDYIRYNIAPPKDLEPECEKMNYVKRDTRNERNKIDEVSEYDILNNVANAYNDRIKKWDVNERPVYVIPKDMDRGDKTPVTVDYSQMSLPLRGNTSEGFFGDVSGGVTGELSEVVVTGYSSKRRSMAGSIAVVTGAEVFSSATSIEQALQGRVAGLDISSSGVPGGASVVTIRGMASIGSSSEPLYVIDGIPVSGNVNDFVNVHDIESIIVLKDQSASAIYGSRAASGAIVITTKKGRTNYSNWYNNKAYRLKDMPDMEYLEELKAADRYEKIDVYEKLREEYGGDAGFYFDVAQHLFECGLKKKAFEILVNATEAANGSQAVIVAIAYTLENWKEFEEAINIYEQLVNDNPFNLNFYRDLAWAHYQAGHYQQAVDVLYAAISMNTAQENINMYAKAMMLGDMNAIIALHGSEIATGAIPSSIIKSLPVDIRLEIDCNKGNLSGISINEPDGQNCNYTNPVTKNGGTTLQGYYWGYNTPFEYQIKSAPAGKYKIKVNYYDYYSFSGSIPTFIRIRKIVNFGKQDQAIEVENVIMDNQYGEIEIAEITR